MLACLLFKTWASETAQWMKAPAAESENLNLNLEKDGENCPSLSSCDFNMQVWSVLPKHTYKRNRMSF